MAKIKVAIAGSTPRTLLCAQALSDHPNFEIVWVLTPTPRPVGRAQTITPNPLHQLALEHHWPSFLVEQKISPDLKKQFDQQPLPDILLVVDFGYLVPTWLLEYPQKAAVNVHPSALPLWRGSSPGQFVLLSGATQSAVTIMVMDEGLDTGAILLQLPFRVESNWTQVEYYQHSFELAQAALPDCLSDFVNGKLTATPQAVQSPTPTARRLSKDDSFVAWSDLTPHLTQAFSDANQADPENRSTSSLLQGLAQHHSWPIVLERATRAFSPWPGLWTMVPTTKGWKRLKIISSELEKTSPNKLHLKKVQLEGQQVANWTEIRNQIS